MSKSKLTILGIVILLIAVIGGGFWYVNKEQGTVSKEQSEIAEQREGAEQNKEGLNNQTEDSQKQEDEQENQEILNAQKQREMMFKKFTLEEAEKLQKEKDLVWYEIPELGVEFLVTKKEKDDLGYNVNKDDFSKDTIYISFYDKSEVAYKTSKLEYNCLDEGGSVGCINGLFLLKTSIETNDSMAKSVGEDVRFVCKYGRNGYGQTVLLAEDEYYICGEIDHQSFDWNSMEEYEQYLKTIGAKTTNSENKVKYPSIYLGTMQKIGDR